MASDRPLSPHLQIYRPQITSMLSIVHRLTGVGLVAGALLFSYWISAATYGPMYFDQAQAIMGSWFGRLVLLGLTFALFFHLANGIRHLAWDIGWGYEMAKLKASGLLVIMFSGALTLLTFLGAYYVAGAI